MLPMSLDIVLRATSDGWRALMASPANNRLMTTIAIAAILSVPVTTAYSVLVARVFDFRIVVRTALRYTLARNTLLLLLLAPSAALIRLLYGHRDLSLHALFTGATGLAALTVTVLAIAALASRTAIVAALDRRYFRDAVEAELILVRMIENCRTAASPQE